MLILMKNQALILRLRLKAQAGGHGVGMSQYGAKGMAEAGYTYDEILTHYSAALKLQQYINIGLE